MDAVSAPDQPIKEYKHPHAKEQGEQCPHGALKKHIGGNPCIQVEAGIATRNGWNPRRPAQVRIH